MAIPKVVKGLLENGVHFGHLSKNWNPKMKRFIFGKKKNIYIIDLEKTAQKLEEAREFVKKTAEDGGKILFVATKRQLRGLIKEAAVSCGMSYVVERWIGGLLTNASTVSTRVKRYISLLAERDKGGFENRPGKEVVRLNREIERMDRNYSGVISLGGLPRCVYIVDPKKEVAAVREAQKLSIPIVALIDTDADPEAIDYPIPGNDDAIKSVKCVTSYLVEAINEGLKTRGRMKEKEELELAKAKEEQTLKKVDSATGEEAEEGLGPKETEEKKAAKRSRRQKSAKNTGSKQK